MEKVIVIEEENHGFIAVAKSYNHAVRWLIKEQWITEDSYASEDEMLTVKERFGDDWQNVLLSFSLDEFNDRFFGNVYLREWNVI